jgi:hypothetical protein
MDAPKALDGMNVVEYGFFTQSILPKGYILPGDGRERP